MDKGYGNNFGIFYSILLFIIIYLAVRLAINPLLSKQDDADTYKESYGLVNLRDIYVLSNTELEEIIELYQKKHDNKQANKQYQKYKLILEELKEMGYFSDEQYDNKIYMLKKHFNAD